MDQMRRREFVGDDSLRLENIGSGVLAMTGEIGCRGQIVVQVEKYLLIFDGEGLDANVQTFDYKYNAFVRGRNNILRYDNAHSYPGHGDAHHKHMFDWQTGEQLPGFPEWVGENGWPTLGEVLEEVEQWYWGNRDDLPEPEKYPKLELRK